MDEINNTTRRYPRTLQEAFPRDYPSTITRYKPLTYYADAIVWLTCAFAIGFLTCLLAYGV